MLAQLQLFLKKPVLHTFHFWITHHRIFHTFVWSILYRLLSAD